MYLSFLVAAFAITDPMVAKLRLPRSPADEAMRTTAVFGGYTYATSRPPLRPCGSSPPEVQVAQKRSFSLTAIFWLTHTASSPVPD